MAPRNIDLPNDAIDTDFGENAAMLAQTMEPKRPPTQIVWRNVIFLGTLHLLALWGAFILPWTRPCTWLFAVLMYLMNALGITAGAHRLWAHRSYNARLPLRILLAIWNSMAFQNDIIEWARDHRVHHKFSETEADPHNAKRGFFFAHCGWLLVRKHPEVKEKGRLIDLDDLYSDPVCIVQRKLYVPSVLLLCFILPAVIPWYYWNENLWYSFLVCSVLRLILSLNVTWFVNSAAHMWGNRPYDKHINPAENFFVTFGAMGEGFHNYHHVFPNDYSTSEYGWKFNLTTFFIDCMAKIGQAYGRKKVPHSIVFRRQQRTGDGSTGFGCL